MTGGVKSCVMNTNIKTVLHFTTLCHEISHENVHTELRLKLDVNYDILNFYEENFFVWSYWVYYIVFNKVCGCKEIFRR